MAPASNDIRYVCLSDLHLGEEDSLLTHVPPGRLDADPTSPSPVLKELANCLELLLSCNLNKTSKPTLILNGDILELALTTDNCAAMAFERFLEAVMPERGPLFGKIIYVPGNHDHHLWESARETQYVRYYLPVNRPGEILDNPWHATNIFMEDDSNQVPSFFLNGLANRYDHLKGLKIDTVYPNFGLRKGNRCVIFHHGHFVESIYRLMTTLKNLIFPKLKDEPRRVWDLEAENFAWIDFFWSSLGRSGDVGKDVEIIYEKMFSETQFLKLLNNLAKGFAKEYGITGLGEWLDYPLARLILYYLEKRLVKTERTLTRDPLSEDAKTGLGYYVNQPLWTQIHEECKDRGWPFPSRVTFAFGHTHKPFERLEKFRAYREEMMPVYNTGGWVVESVEPAPVRGGAVLLLNENLDVASLRLYNETAAPGNYPVEVHEVPHFGKPHSGFFKHLQELIQPGQLHWSRFSETVAKEVRFRAGNLQKRINAGD